MANTLKFGNGNWATKEGSTLAYNDQNGNFKPLPFDFSRASKATVINKDGLIEEVGSGEPRIDYKDDSKGALLLEPSRSNVISYSEDFSNSYWNTNSNTSRSLSSNLSPEGTANAYRVEAVSGTQVGYVGVTTIGTTITHSVYVRRVSGSTTFNMVDVNNSATQVDITNEWKRFSVTAVATSTNLRSYLRLNQVGDVVEIFGFQAEQGSYPTSYIPTQGSAVTRLQDDFTCNLPDSDSFNSSSGFSVITKFGIGQANGSTSVPFLVFNDDTSATYIGFGSNTTNLRCRLNLSGTSYLNTQNAPRTQENSLFVSCDSSGWSQGANGSVGNTGTNNASVFDRLSHITVNVTEVYGIIKIKEILIYNTRLTDQELIALTQV
jgi:hypothetical protein